MCDETDLADFARKGLSRRGFGAGAIAGAAAACAPIDTMPGGQAGALTESAVSFATDNGTADGFFVHPREGRHPGVIFWPDVAGIREAKRQMARRLASEGYAVLVMNPYYRDVAGEQFADFPSFAAQQGFEKVKPWREKLNAGAIGADANSAAAWLREQGAVDVERGIGSQGYCMGGPFAIWSAGFDEHVRAAASFHGGGLVRDGEYSPHRMLDEDAQYLIAVARNDDAKEPETTATLRQTASAGGIDAEIEVYPADHGWCVPDSPAYDHAAAERAWGRLLALYREAL